MEHQTERRLTHDRVILMINDALKGHEDRIISHMDAKMKNLENMIKEGFPNGDPSSHRKVHEQHMQDSEVWKKIRAGAMSHLLNYGLLATLLWIAYAVWASFKESIR